MYMITVLGYELHDKMRHNHNIDTYHALRLKDKRKVLLKIPNNNFTSSENLAILQHEFHVLQTVNAPPIIKAYDFLPNTPAPILILEHVEGQLLSSYILDHTLELGDFFDLAIQLVDIVGELHQRNIIHKEIRPFNIVIDTQNLTLKLIDLSASTKLTEESFDSSSFEQFSEGLAYISPEQTGRINRPVDYRTDFYSLGITFYEMLTNQLPFQTRNSQELIEQQITKKPLSVLAVRRNIPKMLAAIIDKLLEKMPEDRYSSFIGIKSDIVDCYKQWVVKRHVTEYSLGTKDIRDHLSMSHNLYGREHEVQQLFDAYKRVSQASSEIVLIAGYSGVGKTAVVREVINSIVEQHGYFIQGKYDQLRRSMPYSAIVTAFQNLVKQVLAEHEGKLEGLKNQLLHSLGTIGQIVIDVIPEVGLIIGEQPDVPQLNPVDAQIRFNLVFQNFVRVFATEEHPLVIFLDDLQWADNSSLSFIENLLSDSDTQYLLIIGAYRDNEINENHPLQLCLNHLNTSHVPHTHFTLQSLNLNNVQQLLQDALASSIERVQSLADCVFEKTQGNPFFINEFLKLIYQQQLLTFSYDQGIWEWNLEEIKRQSADDNVINLITAKIHLLSKPGQELLKLASCFGHQFDLKTLLVINDHSVSNTAEQLWQAINANLIIPLDESYKTLGLVGLNETVSDLDLGNLRYRFAHDRIQQASYDLIASQDRPAIHLKIGRLLLKQQPLDKYEDRLFTVLKHFNQSILLVDDTEERHLLAQYNYWAGQKAKMESAYDAANEHLSAGIEFLEPVNWSKNYTLAFQLYQECAGCKYLLGDFIAADLYFSELLNHAQCATDRLEVYRLKIEMLSVLGKHTEALHMGLAALREYNINIPEKPNILHLLIAVYKIKFQLRNTKIEQVYLPPMTDVQQKAIVNLITQLLNSAFNINQKLFVILTCKNMSLSFKYGYTESTSMSIPVYAFIIMHSLNLYDEAISFVRLYDRLKQEYGASDFEGKNQFVLGTFIQPYQTSFEECNRTVNNAFRLCCDSGDLVYSNYSKLLLVLHAISAGHNLDEVKKNISLALSFMNRVKITDFITVAKFWEFLVQYLEDGEFAGINKTELFEEEIKNGKSKTELSFFYSTLTRLNFLLGRYEEAVLSGEQHEVYAEYDKGLVSHLDGKFFFALALFSYLPQIPKAKRKGYLKKLKRLAFFIDKYASWCPGNYKVYALLIASELACLDKAHDKALALCEQSIKLALSSGLILIAAIASERAALICLDMKIERVAKFYLCNAHRYYKDWGAVTKVKLLEETYPALLLNYCGSSDESAVSNPTYAFGDTKNLDMLAILKFSQLISGEIRLDRLLQRLLVIVLELSNAERCVLLKKMEDRWIVLAEGNLVHQAIYLNGLEAADAVNVYPKFILNYVEQTQQPIILNDAAQSEFSGQDPYVMEKNPKALLMMPLLFKSQCTRILYLEHRSMSNLFTSDHLNSLHLLMAQIMNSLENSRMFYEVTHDGLTGLSNRNMLYELFQVSTKQLTRTQGTVALIVIEMNHFKSINERYGYEVGDQLLIHIASKLKVNLRKGDILARIGGDEFVVMLTNAPSNAFLASLIEQLIQDLIIPVHIMEQLIQISVNAGVSLYPVHGTDIQSLIKLAEMAMNQSRQIGVNRFKIYTAHRDDELNPRDKKQ
ncbi:AAA family ATPase [Legionella moravica]|nr:AAA family ATPase [Legionella moravica]